MKHHVSRLVLYTHHGARLMNTYHHYQKAASQSTPPAWCALPTCARGHCINYWRGRVPHPTLPSQQVFWRSPISETILARWRCTSLSPFISFVIRKREKRSWPVAIIQSCSQLIRMPLILTHTVPCPRERKDLLPTPNSTPLLVPSIRTLTVPSLDDTRPLSV